MKESTKFHLTINSVKESIANTENKKKYLIGYKSLIVDKTLSEYMAGKLSTAGISVETLQQVAANKGVDGLDALL